VDKEFWNRLFKLVKIVLPSWKSREARYIYFLTALLVVRTFMSIWLADVNGRVVKAIVNKSLPEFFRRVSQAHSRDRESEQSPSVSRFSTSFYSLSPRR